MTIEMSLSADELFDLADRARAISSQLEEYRRKLRAKGEIGQEQANTLQAFEFALLEAAKRLATSATAAVLTDLQNPGAKIEEATGKLIRALQELQQINKIIGVVAAVVNVFAAIVGAVTTPGLPGVAKIIGAFDEVSSALAA
jgi:HPt (histidine-containing phosphotransfer) domain-containing protein